MSLGYVSESINPFKMYINDVELTLIVPFISKEVFS